MRKIAHPLVAGIILAAVFVSSCSKKNTNTAIYGSYSSIDNIYASLSLFPKTVTINAARDTSFYGNSGTRYIFSANTLQTAGGVSVTGLVQVTVAEYLQKGDMIFSKMLPVTSTTQLLSGGEINVSATQSGQPLYLKPLATFQANVPQGTVPMGGMSLFFGTAPTDTSTNKVIWGQATIDSGSSGIGVVIGAGDTLSIFSDSLRECNADQFLTSPVFQNFNVTVNVNNELVSSSAQIHGYVLFDGYKAIWPLGEIGSYKNGVFNELHTPNIAVHFVIFTLINGNFYGGTLAASPITGGNYTVNLTAIDPNIFKEEINSL